MIFLLTSAPLVFPRWGDAGYSVTVIDWWI